jgi:hypothetical protein
MTGGPYMQIVRRKCQDCGHVGLIAYCPACRGRSGGKSKSPKKVKASRRAAKRALEARKARAR